MSQPVNVYGKQGDYHVAVEATVLLSTRVATRYILASKHS